jgi:F-actin capping protein alpha subunit
MEHADLERLVQGGCQKLDGSCQVESVWAAHTVRTCRTNSDDASFVTTAPSTLLDYMQIKLHDYQERYRTKRVTARYTVATATATKPVGEDNGALKGDGEDGDDDDDAVVLDVHTYAEHLDAANCHAGCWSAAWHIVVRSEQEAQLDGAIAFHGHASECGSNVQTRATRTFPLVSISTQEEVVNSLVAKFEQTTMTYAEQLATMIVAHIATYETEWHEALNEMYNSHVEDALRKLRRILPITKTRFKWDSAAQRNVQLLNARTTK